MTARSPLCALDENPATQWSGAFGDPWVGWCSNDCKNRWLNGERAVDSRPHTAQTGAE